ncbi:DHH family phosphoesterase, partial [Vibrio astriarenae]
GEIPQHGNLDAHIDLDANMCTALIVDQLLEGRFHTWAITAAYGDNLIAKADALADKAGLSEEQKAQLKELGTLINYNGYGAKVDDLHFHPADLY